jgi:hypothetical protein
MPIQFHCETCRTAYTVKDELAGKRTKCAKCRAALQVPSEADRVDTPALDKSAGSAEYFQNRGGA